MRKWGDRRDAVRVRNLDGMHHYMAYLMPKRTDAEVYINETIDVTEVLRYIAEKNASGERKVSVFSDMLMYSGYSFSLFFSCCCKDS